jgi:hypothetical protein
MIPISTVQYTELENITYEKKKVVHPSTGILVGTKLITKRIFNLVQSALLYFYLRFSAAGMFTFGGTEAATGGVTFLTGAAVAVAVGRGG